MKMLVIGLSPYLLTSRSKLNALILKYLYVSGHEVCGAVWSHDTSYFVPETDESGKQQHYFEFDLTSTDGDTTKHRIPIVPFHRGQNESIAIYEIVQSLKPETVVTIGDYTDFLYMKAVKMFDRDIMWIFVLTNYSDPITENRQGLIDAADAVLCSSEFGRLAIESNQQQSITKCYVGSSHCYNWVGETCRSDRFRIMSCAKNSQSDNVATLIESVSEVREDIPEIELYLHTNVYDSGDYDIHEVIDRFDPRREFIVLPEKYVSLLEGVTDQELAVEYRKSDMFVSIPMVAATSMSVLESIACGCFPLMSDCGSNREIAALIKEHLGQEYESKDFLVRCVKLMSGDGSYLSVADPVDLKQKILLFYRNRIKHKGYTERLSELKWKQSAFLTRLSGLIQDLDKHTNIICLESV